MTMFDTTETCAVCGSTAKVWRPMEDEDGNPEEGVGLTNVGSMGDLLAHIEGAAQGGAS